jgi:hypothetical protein
LLPVVDTGTAADLVRRWAGAEVLLVEVIFKGKRCDENRYEYSFVGKNEEGRASYRFFYSDAWIWFHSTNTVGLVEGDVHVVGG